MPADWPAVDQSKRTIAPVFQSSSSRLAQALDMVVAGFQDQQVKTRTHNIHIFFPCSASISFIVLMRKACQVARQKAWAEGSVDKLGNHYCNSSPDVIRDSNDVCQELTNNLESYALPG